MRLHLIHTHVRRTDPVVSSIGNSLAALLPLVRIDEARVTLEYSADASPPYRASAHLRVPGPDLRTEATDHTLHAAVLKLMQRLRQMAVQRAARRLRRGRVAGGSNFVQTSRARPASRLTR